MMKVFMYYICMVVVLSQRKIMTKLIYLPVMLTYIYIYICIYIYTDPIKLSVHLHKVCCHNFDSIF